MGYRGGGGLRGDSSEKRLISAKKLLFSKKGRHCCEKEPKGVHPEGGKFVAFFLFQTCPKKLSKSSWRPKYGIILAGQDDGGPARMISS